MITLNPLYRFVDALEMELAFGDDTEITYGDALSLVEEEQKGLDDYNCGASDASAKVDTLETLISDAFTHLQNRQALFGNSYPFQMDKSSRTSKYVRVEKMSNAQTLYAFLLACSHLSRYDKKIQIELTNVFEDVCVPVAANYMAGEASRFGAAGRKRCKTFAPKLKDAITELAEHLNGAIIPVNINEIANKNTGDCGIDIVVRKPFPGNNKLFGMLTALGQCTCSELDWKRKVHQSLYGNKVSQYFYLKHDAVNLFFVPFFWQDLFGKWDNEAELSSCIPFDRLRICQLMTDEDTKDLAGFMKKCLEKQPKLVGYSA